MKCDDVRRAFDQYSVDLEAVKHHMEQCPDCADEFARELETEEALGGLHSGLAWVDITGDVRSAIARIKAERARRNLVRRWIWLTVTVAGFAVLLVTMPDLASWINAAFEAVREVARPQSAAYHTWPALLQVRSAHLLSAMAAILAWAVIRIWQEAKATPR